MKVLNNKKGSAMLWTVLLTVIIAILLSAVMTATYAYFNYTMYTVKRQQAYFTARSAISALVEEFSSEEDVDPVLLPDRNASVEITDFGFPAEMGTATAKLTRGDDDKVEIEVTAVYADEEYKMTSTVVKQPLYFAGIAIKNLTLNGNLTLGENTDLYWNNEKTFDLRNTNYNIILSGSLVTKGDAIIKSGTVIAGHEFDRDVRFSKTNSRYTRKIWSPTEYVLSNKTLYVADDGTTEYTSSVINTMSNIGNYTIKYCNNTEANSGSFGFAGAFFDNDLMDTVVNILGLDNLFTDLRNESMSLTDQSNDALAIKYIKLLSLSQSILDLLDDWADDGNWFEKLVGSWTKELVGDWFTTYGFRIFDVSYIEFNARNESTRDDDVIPIVYLFADRGLTIRVKYGKNPAKQSNLFQFTENIDELVTDFINNAFRIENNMSYVIVYMEEGSTLELGCVVGGRNANAKSNGDLIFAYSVYGGENTTVVLNEGVTVLGEIYCDNLKVNGNAQIVYTNSTGSQIAKQKVAEFWTVSNYSD